MGREVAALIVDDSRAICQMLEQQLVHYGVERVAYCHNGEDALAQVNANPTEFDVLFIDLHMDRMDGLELMHQLNKLRYRGGIVIISALDNRIVNFALELVSNYHLRVLGSLEKPFETSLIAFMVRRIKNSCPPPPQVETMPKRREVQTALQEQKLLTYFQPQIAAADNRITGFECLTRLDLGEKGIISPARFVPVVEKFNLFSAMLSDIFDGISRHYDSINAAVGQPCQFSVNLSPTQLSDDALPETLAELVAEHRLSMDSIVLEITENHALVEERQLKNLNRLRIHGFKLSLDDYGAGFTNLRQIKSLPFNEIKLDALMVDGLHKDRVLRIIVDSVRRVTRELELTLVAEGIVDPQDMDVLTDLGVDVMQGFLFCRPRPGEEVLRWIPHWQELAKQANHEWQGRF